MKPIINATAICLLVVGLVLGLGTLAVAQDSRFGVLVMAHGGSEQWNQSVLDTVQPLNSRYPVQVAFGMADAASLQSAVDQLEARGVTRIGVVRLFVSGDSWYQRTLQILGLQEGPPALAHGEGSHGPQSAGGEHGMSWWPVSSHAQFAVSREGLAEAEEVEQILLDRVRRLSTDPATENLLILAHGTQSDEEDRNWVRTIYSRTRLLRENLAFNHIKVLTLREDWQPQRELAEQQVRDYVAAAQEAGREVIVVPFRVQGFGPYEQVLEGLPYRADKLGLTPHPNIGVWIERQAGALLSELF